MYDDMSKSELIELLKSIEEKRAFTYEDQMKLAILDNSPFTVWASDRYCFIRLWEGQCEAIYGYTKECAIGKDYVDLFVHPDEQLQARIDQLSIIDRDVKFHNLANDHGKNGNTFTLITNCFRIKDPKTGEDWNAEMGLIIDYLKEEQDRLRSIVEESRKVTAHKEQFILSIRQVQQQFHGRKSALRGEIAQCQQKAIGRRMEFKHLVETIIKEVERLSTNLDKLIESYSDKMHTYGTAIDCESTSLHFTEECDDIFYEFADVVADFGEINSRFSGDNTVLQMKENILKDISSKQTQISRKAFDLFEAAIADVDDFKRILGANQNSSMLNAKMELKERSKHLKYEIEDFFSSMLVKINALTDVSILEALAIEINHKCRLFENQLEEIKKLIEDE